MKLSPLVIVMILCVVAYILLKKRTPTDSRQRTSKKFKSIPSDGDSRLAENFTFESSSETDQSPHTSKATRESRSDFAKTLPSFNTNAGSHSLELVVTYHGPEDSVTSHIFTNSAPKKQFSDKGDDYWVPVDKTMSVSGYTISGLVYIGNALSSIRHSQTVDPALIDPALPVSKNGMDRTGETMDYWPSYNYINPTARAAYLNWLATGKKDPTAYIGYVFLYFYGLERRALHDAKSSPAAKSELPVIEGEVQRLLSIYGHNSSFRGYASGFLDILASDPSRFKHRKLTLPTERTGWDLPFTLRMGLGVLASRKMPLPRDWAYSWFILDPETRLKVPAKRCPAEFKFLFFKRYRETYGDGIILKDAKKRLRCHYRPASASFATASTIEINLPDVTTLKKPQNDLRALSDAVYGELDAYSRYIGRNSESVDSIDASALLPADILWARPPKSIKELFDWLKAQGVFPNASAKNISFKTVSASELMKWFPSFSQEKFTKKETETIVELLSKLKVGVEPDIRFYGPPFKNDTRCILFYQPECNYSHPPNEYHAATLLLHLASLVAHADGQIDRSEKQHMAAYIDSAFNFPAPERIRLHAHTLYLLENPQSMAGIKKRLEGYSKEDKETIASVCVALACADGQIAPDELKTLQKIYKTLGLDESLVYSHVHDTASSDHSIGQAQSTAPIRTFDEASTQTPTPSEEPAEKNFTLDPELIRKKMQNTQKVAKLLEGIFKEQEEKIEETPLEAVATTLIPGLDEPHSRLLRRLLERDEWELSEITPLAKELGLMTEGALENINEAAFEEFGEAVLDLEDDPILVEKKMLEEIVHAA